MNYIIHIILILFIILNAIYFQVNMNHTREGLSFGDVKKWTNRQIMRQINKIYKKIMEEVRKIINSILSPLKDAAQFIVMIFALGILYLLYLAGYYTFIGLKTLTMM